MQIPIFLVGFGHVGRRFVRLLDEMRPALAARGVDPLVVGVLTRTHGLSLDDAGLDPFQSLRATSSHLGQSPLVSPTEAITASLCSLKAETRVLIETTTLDVRSGEPA